MKFSIVVPCYNEADNIPLILKRFKEVTGNMKLEVMLVDNGSTDATPKILPELLKEYPFAKSIRVEINQGYGYGIIQGLKACKGDYIGWTHADMQTDPGDVVKAYKLIKKYQGQKLFVKGIRKGRPWFDVFFSKGMGVFESVYFCMWLSDINAQPNIFPKKFFETWDSPPYDFSLDLYAYYEAKKQGLAVRRFAVRFPKRMHGKSKWDNEGLKSKYKFIKRTISFSVALKTGL